MVTRTTNLDGDSIIRLPGISEHPAECILSQLEIEILKIVEKDEPSIVKVFRITRLISTESERASGATSLEIHRENGAESSD
jgi:hypothetical protein